jgi:L-lactate utilization protein LutC
MVTLMQMSEITVEQNAIETRPSAWLDTLPDRKKVEQTLEALRQRGVQAETVQDRREALRRLIELIPAGSEVMTGGSRTLEEIGFLELLKSDAHGWKNVRAEILAEKDQKKQMDLRARAVLSDYFVGSVQAVTQAGEVVIASASGSQLAAYAYGAKNVIWMVWTQKVVPTLEDGLRRVREHALPLEDQRMKGIGYPGSFIGKILIFERKGPVGTVNLIFVNERLGF